MKKGLKKFWNFIWKDESILGWLTFILILFFLTKFIFLPLLSLIAGSALPLAIVESCSMYHAEGFPSFNNWWEENQNKYSEFNVSKTEFRNFPLYNGFNKGDIILITRANTEKLKVGEIIVFEAKRTNPIIHRIVAIKEIEGKKVFSTQGDNNSDQHPFEKEISEKQIIGKATIKVAPYVGWIKLLFFEKSRSPSERGFC
jgi:hypothetical protein